MASLTFYILPVMGVSH